MESTQAGAYSRVTASPFLLSSLCHSPHSFPFINATFLDEVPRLSLFRRPLISSGPLVYFKHGSPQLSGSRPFRCQVLAVRRMTSQTQARSFWANNQASKNGKQYHRFVTSKRRLSKWGAHLWQRSFRSTPAYLCNSATGKLFVWMRVAA